MQQGFFKAFFAKLAHEAVGVVFGGQEEKMQGFAVFELGQGVFQRTPCGFLPCGVAIKAEVDVVGLAKQDFDVFGGGGGAQRGNGVSDAVLGEGNGVHVAFYHEDAPYVFDGLAGFV